MGHLTIFYSESNVFNSVSVLCEEIPELCVTWIQGSCEGKYNFIELDYMSYSISLASFKPLIGHKIEAKSGCVVGSSLFWVRNIKSNVVKLVNLWRLKISLGLLVTRTLTSNINITFILTWVQ